MDKQGINYLQRIRAETLHMEQFIDDILNLSHVSRGEMIGQHVNLSDLTQSITDNHIENQSERQVEFLVQDNVHA